MTTPFYRYETHYCRIGNAPPDWDSAVRDPSRFACKSEWLPASKSGRILDFGCALGNLLMSLWAAGYRDLEGVELVPEQAKVAQQAAEGRARIWRRDGLDYLKDKPSHYDLIVMNDVIEHIPLTHVSTVLNAVRESLVPGGALVMRTPNMASILASFSRYLDITHVAGYTEFSLIQLLEQVGFVNHRFVPQKVCQLSSWRPWAPWRGLGLSGLANIIAHRALYGARQQLPMPTQIGFNLEVVTHRGA